jgi:hypothetical protein
MADHFTNQQTPQLEARRSRPEARPALSMPFPPICQASHIRFHRFGSKYDFRLAISIPLNISTSSSTLSSRSSPFPLELSAVCSLRVLFFRSCSLATSILLSGFFFEDLALPSGLLTKSLSYFRTSSSLSLLPEHNSSSNHRFLPAKDSDPDCIHRISTWLSRL